MAHPRGRGCEAHEYVRAMDSRKRSRLLSLL